jgi:hypothetical protein
MRHKVRPVAARTMEIHLIRESAMRKLPPLALLVYKAYLRSRLDRCQRHLRTIAAQRENDFHAERLLHREVAVVRSKLHTL